MKRMLLAVFSALTIGVSAQITVTSATFPVAGDTLRFAFDESPDGINPATPPGGNQIWDFSSLSKDQTDNIIYRAANTGMNFIDFPSAELMVDDGAGETFYNVTNNRFEVLGYAGADPVGFNLDVSTPFSPALVERRSPMNFFDINASTSNISVAFGTNQPPLDSIFSAFPVNIDSMRVRVNTSRTDVVDGFGNCIIPGGQYAVLRMKRTEYRTTSIDVYVLLFPGFGNWVDLSTLIGGGGGGGFGNFIGTDTTTTYRFYSGTEKEEIAVATMSNDLSTVERVRFKENQTSAAPDLSDIPNASISAFPNPAVDWVRFDCTNLPADEYTLKIFNIIGKVVWKETHQLSGNRSIRIELDNFKKGTYLYSLTDKKGNIIGTKRLVVLKP